MSKILKPPALSKTCCACQLEKPIEAFYPRPGGKYYTSECKMCMKLRGRKQKRVSRRVSLVQSETDLIAELSKNGIPALPGKALGQKWCDVVAYGAVMLECKSAWFKDGQFHFPFTESQTSGNIQGHIIVLVCRYEGDNTFHSFPANHPLFFKKNGARKSAVTWTPERDKRGRPSALTDDMMTAAQDNWQLVHDYLKQISDRLRFGEQLPIRLAA